VQKKTQRQMEVKPTPATSVGEVGEYSSVLTTAVYGALSPIHTSNNVEATFDFVEKKKFQRKTHSTLLPFLATKSNVASTLLLVWTGLYGRPSKAP